MRLPADAQALLLIKLDGNNKAALDEDMKEAQIEVMCGGRPASDPNGILNPGKILP